VSDPVRSLYHALIVAHERAPRNAGPLPGATHEATVDNPLCGDVVTVRLRLDDDGRVAEVRFEGRGCALSQAAASIMTTQVVGRDRESMRGLAAAFEAFVRAAPDPTGDAVAAEDRLGDLAVFVGVRRFKSRQACALLPFRALTAALDATP
jgi:nitrogen fixation protein NifU and related proteins